jgi:hypothetical protein
MTKELSTEQQRESVRTRNQVRLITEGEEGWGIDRLPPGVYGFAYAPGTESTPLFGTRTYLGYEMHKKPNGEVDLLGFLEAELARAIDSGQQDVEIRLSPEATPEKPVLVPIPTERILRTKEHSHRDGQGMIMQVAGFQ